MKVTESALSERAVDAWTPHHSSAATAIRLPECSPGIGTVIRTPDASGVIAGIRLEPCDLWADDRGHFLEVLRCGHGLAAGFPAATTQVSATLSFPGTIKAFHYHVHQSDCWTPAAGMLQVVLVDLRPASRTFGLKNTLYVGVMRPWQVLIPPGVAHGYKVIGADPAVLVYVTSRFYDPTDEGRIAHDDPLISYDWTTQHR